MNQPAPSTRDNNGCYRLNEARTKSLRLRSMFMVSMSICAFSAMAQNSLGFLKDSPVATFSEQDFDLMKTAASAVLGSNDAGTTQAWSNASSGNSGKIKLLRSFSASDGRSCKRLRIENHSKAMSGVYTTNVCRAEGGRWLIDPEALSPN